MVCAAALLLLSVYATVIDLRSLVPSGSVSVMMPVEVSLPWPACSEPIEGIAASSTRL